MRKRTKWTALLGILLAGVMLLSACGESSGSASAGSGSEAAAASGSAGTAGERETNGNQEADPVSGSSGSQGETAVSDMEPVELTVAFCCWSFADEASMTYQKYLNYISNELMTLEQPIKINWEWVTCFSPEEQLTNLEAIHEKGIDGVITLYLSEAMINAFEEWQIPFANYNYAGPDIEARAAESPYYVGNLTPGVEALAEAQMEYVVNTLHCKEVLCLGPAPGLVSHDGRFPVYEEYAAEHPDMIFYESRTDEPRTDVVNTMLYMHPGIDCIVDTAASGGYGEAVVQTLRTNGLGHGEVKYVTFDFIEDQEQAMEDGIIVFTQGGGEVSIMHLFVALLNRMMGTPLADSARYWAEVQPITMTTAEEYRDYKKYVRGRVPAYTMEDYEPYFKWIHPEATAEGLNKVGTDMSLEDIKERHAAYFE